MKIHIVEKCPAGYIFNEYDFDKIRQIMIVETDSNLGGAGLIDENGSVDIDINLTKEEILFLDKFLNSYKEKINDNI